MASDGNTLESLVKNSLGDSVTPSRLEWSKQPGIVRRLLGNGPVSGPFTDDLDQGEQPHYLFHTTHGVDLPEEVAQSGALLELFGRSIFSPATMIVTDSRILLIFNSKNGRTVQRLPFTELDNIEYSQLPKIKKGITFEAAGSSFSFEMWETEDHSDELADAVVYVSKQSGAEYHETSYDFTGSEFDAALQSLREQLQGFEGIPEDVDKKHILLCAKKGAEVGVKRGPRGAFVGFLLGGGYGLLEEIIRSTSPDSTTDSSSLRLRTEDIDAKETASTMLSWQKVAEQVGGKRAELAGAVVGAAVAIDQQTGSGDRTRVLAALDLEQISSQLESGDVAEMGIDVASEALEMYSSEVEDLVDDDFFERMP